MTEDKPVEIKLAKDLEYIPGGRSEIEILDSYWNPLSRRITLKDTSPLGTAHEIAHARLEHDISGSSLVELSQEADAWKYALRRINPEEVRVNFVRRSMVSYLGEVAGEFGKGSPQYQFAGRKVREVVEYARKSKKEAR